MARTESTIDRPRDPRRGETWREVWARVRSDQPPAATRVTRGGRTQPTQPDGTTPLERDERPIDQSG
jgi:hypothetical protein